MKKVVIAGGSGFLGRELAHQWNNKELVILTRDSRIVDNKRFVYWDGESLGEWKDCLEGADLLLNLSGKSVNCRYNEENKKAIIDSRVLSTKVLGEAIKACHTPPKVWMNSSSATIYRHALDKPMTESEGEIGEGFSVEVCKAWEKALEDVKGISTTRKVALRTSIVMGPEKGGVYEALKGLVLSGMGGRQGNGNQYVSWIHIEDYIKAIEFIYNHEELENEINICAPNPDLNTNVMAALRKSLGVWFKLDLAPWMIKLGALLRGTEPELVLKSRRVVPEKLLNAGFRFKFNVVEAAFEDIASIKNCFR